jgi:hypothetical protein
MREGDGRCIARHCQRPAIVELMLTFTDGATIRLALCDMHEPEIRELVPERRAAAPDRVA